MDTAFPLWRTVGFRIAAIYFALFWAVAVLAGFALYNIMAARLVAVGDNIVWRDAAMVSAAYHRGGRAAAIAFINQRTQADGLFYLADGVGQFLAGNLKKIPPPEDMAQQRDDWLEFKAGENLMRGRMLPLAENLVLLVARDIGGTKEFIARMGWFFIAAAMLLAAVGMLGALALARANVRRVVALNDDLREIMKGNIAARMQRDTRFHEFDALAAQINRALQRIATLMTAMREVTDNLAHELRAPLTRLRGRLEQMSDSENARAALADIDGVLAGFAALLSLSRLESGIARERRAACDINRLLADMFDLYEPVFAEAKMTLTTDMEKDLPPLMGDQDLLAQALVNLLENALRHAAIGAVSLMARQNDAGLEIAIADEGPGIEPSDFERMQQRFVREASSGYGLGLSLAGAVARAHGGRLELASNAPRGLIARLHLPFDEGDGDVV